MKLWIMHTHMFADSGPWYGKNESSLVCLYGQILSWRCFRRTDSGGHSAFVLPSGKAWHSHDECLLSFRGDCSPGFLCTSGEGWSADVVLICRPISVLLWWLFTIETDISARHFFSDFTHAHSLLGFHVNLCWWCRWQWLSVVNVLLAVWWP